MSKLQMIVRGNSPFELQKRINDAAADGYAAVSIAYGQGEWVALVEKDKK